MCKSALFFTENANNLSHEKMSLRKTANTSFGKDFLVFCQCEININSLRKCA